jgi:hypothetical protein
MPWWTWLALGFFALAVVATAIFAAFAIRRIMPLAAASERIQSRLDELAVEAEALNVRVAHTQERVAEAERARAQLEGSLERLSVLTRSLQDARRGMRRLHTNYLRK